MYFPPALQKTKTQIGLCFLLLLLTSLEAEPLPKGPPNLDTYSTPRLLKLLTSSNKVTSRQALWALIRRQVNHPRLTRAMIRRLENKPEDVSWELLDELTKRGESAHKAYEPAKKILKQGEGEVQVYAAALIFSISGQSARQQEALGWLEKKWKRYYHRPAIIHGLASSGKKVLPYLNPMLKSASPKRRMMATDILGLIARKHKQAIPGLVLALEDRDTHISLRAIEALHRLGPKTLPYLRPKLKSKKIYHRMAAASVISSFAPEELHFLRQDPHPLLRYLAHKPPGIILCREDLYPHILSKEPPQRILELFRKETNLKKRWAFIGAINETGKRGLPVMYRALRETRGNGEAVNFLFGLLHYSETTAEVFHRVSSLLWSTDPLDIRAAYNFFFALELNLNELDHVPEQVSQEAIRRVILRSVVLAERGSPRTRRDANYYLAFKLTHLQKAGGKKLVKRVIAMMHRNNKSSQKHLRIAAGLFFKDAPGSTANLLLAELEGGTVQRFAREHLRKAGSGSKQRLRSLMNSPNKTIRYQALKWALKLNMKDPATLKTLKNQLENRDSKTRGIAAYVLISLKEARAEELLPQLLEGLQVPWVYDSIWKTLQTLPIQKLKKGLRSPILLVQVRTAETLRHMERKSPAVFKRFTELLRSPNDETVRLVLSRLNWSGIMDQKFAEHILALIRKNRLKREAVAVLYRLNSSNPELKKQLPTMYANAVLANSKYERLHYWKFIRKNLREE